MRRGFRMVFFPAMVLLAFLLPAIPALRGCSAPRRPGVRAAPTAFVEEGRPAGAVTVAPVPTRTRTAPPTGKPTYTPPATAPSVPEGLVAALCVAVVDGDTIDVEMAGRVYRVRYIGIDTPETVHPQKPVEWMGKEATEANRALVEGREVFLEKDVSEVDQYGRLLRYVYVMGTGGKLIMVNRELVRRGFARVSTYPPDVRYVELFLEAEREARAAGVGLWGPTPIVALPLPSIVPTPRRPASVPPTQPPPPATGAPPSPPVPSQPGQVRIAYIFYDGLVPRVESDEYAVIENVGSVAVNLAGWRLNAGDAGQDFWFPDFVLQPGQVCRVYTNEVHPEWCGFSFGSGRALWNNKGECGHLFDAAGVEVARYCYP